ncbi:hypothetical protein ACQKMD_08550 [Viridibacillus sp. NPDC096237]|uniref:hypothetical protein n=1 Tax=Viridibacillus sp. NPDC096237 TaxID=3390721 RepID=UPI003CFF4BBB
MDDKKFEDRMKLLKKSYDKVPSKFQQQEVLEQIKIEQQNVIIEKPAYSKSRNLPIWLVGVASLFVIGIISLIMLYGNDYQLKQGQIPTPTPQTDPVEDSYKELIKELIKEYPKYREQSRESLHMTEKSFKELGFVQLADAQFRFYKAENKYSEITIGNTYSQFAYEQLIREIMPPTYLISTLIKQSKEESSDIVAESLQNYRSKMIVLKEHLNSLLVEYNDELKALQKGGAIDVQGILAKKEQLPEDFQKALQMAEEQNIVLKSVESDLTFGFDTKPVIYQLENVIPKRMLGYLEMMNGEPYTVGGSLAFPPEETAKILVKFENTMNYKDEETGLLDVYKGYYTNMAYYLIKGSDQLPVFDANGKVKDVYRKAWDILLKNGPYTTPSKSYLYPIVKEFEASNWTSSTRWEYLDFSDVESALNNALYLDQINLETDSPEFDGSYFEMPTDITVEFENRVQDLYRLFTKKHEQAILKNAKAIEIAGLYFYTIQMDDFESFYELLAKNEAYGQLNKQLVKDQIWQSKNLMESTITKKKLSEEFKSVLFIQDTETDYEDGKVGLVTWTFQSGKERHGEKTLDLQLVKEENGWRIPLNPTK